MKWETLEHSGVQFPPEYTPHGIKMLYDGKPVDLNPKQEEVHTSSVPCLTLALPVKCLWSRCTEMDNSHLWVPT